jgi:hypothetical protein
MKHVTTCDTTMEHGQLIGQALCSCGWSGKRWDISEPSERQAYDSEVRVHRITVGAARFFGCLMLATGLTWFVLLAALAVWFVRWVT